jgi:phosphotriesterase-related protein
MDRYGLDIILPEDRRNATVMALLERGHAGRMFLSADACAEFDWFPLEMIEQGQPNWKSTHVMDAVVPALREAGMTDEQLGEMMVENPKRWLGS